MEPSPAKMSSATEIEPKQLLPDDLVLEIAARCRTAAAVVRCAAASKAVRRGILNEPFVRRRLRDHGYGDHPFIPGLLLGLYHQSDHPRRPPPFVPAATGVARLPPLALALPPPEPDRVDGDACAFGPYLPVASRRSLLVLRRRCAAGARHPDARHGPHPVELTVCNPATGERRVLPPHAVPDMSHALLDADPIAPPPSSFTLLVAELSEADPSTLYAQVYSSAAGEWGPPLACPITYGRQRLDAMFAGGGRPRPVVLGDTVHWLCTWEYGDAVLTWRHEQHRASLVRLPRGREHGQAETCLAVLPSPAADDDAAGPPSQQLLGLIVLDRGAIEVWARERSGGAGAATWSWELWHRVEEASISRPVGFRSGWLRDAEVTWFCEGSGTLVLQAGDGSMSPLLLDLDSMEVRKVAAPAWELHPEPEFCPYEVDLLSYMLFLMKRF